MISEKLRPFLLEIPQNGSEIKIYHNGLYLTSLINLAIYTKASQEVSVKNFSDLKDGKTVVCEMKDGSTLELNFIKMNDRILIITATAGEKGFKATLRRSMLESYLGGGERFERVEATGLYISLNTCDVAGEEKDPFGLYKPIPLLLSNRGYGIFFETPGVGYIDVAYSKDDEINLFTSLNTLTLYIIRGIDYDEILYNYYHIVGRPKIPPKWAFNTWKSRDVYQGEEEVYEDAEQMRAHKIPCNVIVIDSPWETSFNTFEFNRAQFPRPEIMLTRLRRLGYKVLLWLTPMTNKESIEEVPGCLPFAENFEYCDVNGFFFHRDDGSTYLVKWWKGVGGMFDFTNPQTRMWWIEQLEKLLQKGIDGFKLDDGELLPLDSVSHDGRRGGELHNLYPNLYVEASFEAADKYEALLFARSGYAGIAKYACLWNGDRTSDFSFATGLPSAIISCINASVSGIPFITCDIGGYIGETTAETFIRWAEFASLLPIMAIHGQGIREPWRLGETVIKIYRFYANFHASLFPYFYSLSVETTESGSPLVRPIAYEYPFLPHTYLVDYQFFLGRSLLVAPIYSPDGSRSVYLPPGRWIDYWTGEKMEGGSFYYISNLELDKIPIYVREGSIIPLIEPVDTFVDVEDLLPEITKLSDIENKLILDIFPSEEESVFKLYDGSIYRCKLDYNRLSITSQLSPMDRKHILLIHIDWKPVVVTSGGVPLEETSISQPEGNWIYDEKMKILKIMIPVGILLVEVFKELE